MPYLTAAVILVGSLSVLNLVLAAGILKRLREHTELLTAEPPGPYIGIGDEITDFDATTVDDEPVGRDTLREDTLVAFFSPTCGPCKDKLPRFVEHARALPGGREQTLVTVVGEADAAARFVSALRPVARVIVEERGGALSTAFRAAAYPTLLRVSPDATGRVLVVDNHADVDRPAAVPA